MVIEAILTCPMPRETQYLAGSVSYPETWIRGRLDRGKRLFCRLYIVYCYSTEPRGSTVLSFASIRRSWVICTICTRSLGRTVSKTFETAHKKATGASGCRMGPVVAFARTLGSRSVRSRAAEEATLIIRQKAFLGLIRRERI